MRLTLGSPAPDFSAESIGGRGVSLEQLRGRPLLLKFYRFATCPVCNLHMHRFIMEHRMVSDAGLTTIVFYHSPADKLADAQDFATPFDLIPDPDKRIFRAYGVERGRRGLVSPTVKAWRSVQGKEPTPNAHPVIPSAARDRRRPERASSHKPPNVVKRSTLRASPSPE